MPKGLVRYQQSRCFHFITFSCCRRLPLLNKAHAYGAFESELDRVRRRFGLFVIGYVLMPEHVHLLVTEPDIKTLAIAVQVLKQKTSKQLKAPSEVRFWQPRYYDFNVWSEDKPSEKLRYIHRNPVRRGLVAKPEDWPWSSYRHYQTGNEYTVQIESHWTQWRREHGSLPLSPQAATEKTN
jgi:putative transposase